MTEAPAEILVPLADQKVVEKETATFQCEVSKPNLKPTWKKGEQELKHGDRFDISTVGQKHMLTIRDCQVEDQDKYTIVVEEGVESTANLTVEGRKHSHFSRSLYLSQVDRFKSYLKLL